MSLVRMAGSLVAQLMQGCPSLPPSGITRFFFYLHWRLPLPATIWLNPRLPTCYTRSLLSLLGLILLLCILTLLMVYCIIILIILSSIHCNSFNIIRRFTFRDFDSAMHTCTRNIVCITSLAHPRISTLSPFWWYRIIFSTIVCKNVSA